MSFFKEQQGAAVIKHGILRRYLPIFTRKTGSTAPGARVVYLDGYAGPGAYDDGTPGSPILAAATAEMLQETRRLRCLYVERSRIYCDRLNSELAKHSHDFRVLHGSIEDRLDECLVEARGSPLLAFFDPFGLGLPFRDLVDKVLSRPRWPATEVLLNFSFPGLQRNAGKVDPERSGWMDDKLGGSGWWPLWEGDAADRETQVAAWFVDRIRQAAGEAWSNWMVPVTKRLGGPPVYCLILLTRHPDGMWHFYDCIAGGMEDFREFCLGGQLELGGDDLWVPEIKRNVTQLLEKEGAFDLANRLADVLGSGLGRARTRCIRQAIKELPGQVVGDALPPDAREDLLQLPGE